MSFTSVVLLVAAIFAFHTFAKDVRGEGEHDHNIMNGADMDYHFEECQVCLERFNVKEHTFKDDKCTVYTD